MGHRDRPARGASAGRRRHTNEETLLETHDALGADAIPTKKIAVAAAGAVVLGAVAGYAVRRSVRAAARGCETGRRLPMDGAR